MVNQELNKTIQGPGCAGKGVGGLCSPLFPALENRCRVCCAVHFHLSVCSLQWGQRGQKSGGFLNVPSKTTQSCYSLRVVALLGLALSQTRPSIVEFHLRAETQCLAVSYRLHASWMGQQ